MFYYRFIKYKTIKELQYVSFKQKFKNIKWSKQQKAKI